MLVLLIGILQYRFWLGKGNIFEIVHLNKTLHLQNEDLKKLEIRNKMLKAEVKALKTNSKAFEERARLEHGMIKKDETFCLIVESK